MLVTRDMESNLLCFQEEDSIAYQDGLGVIRRQAQC